MSKTQPGEAQQSNACTKTELKRGKKRKRKGGDVGRDIRKGTGKVNKFEDEEPNRETVSEATSTTLAKATEPATSGEDLDNKTTKRPKSEHRPKVSRSEPKSQDDRGKRQNHSRRDHHGAKQISNGEKNYQDPKLIRRRDELLPKRKALPIWSQAAAIRQRLRDSNVLVLTGETGSGKSSK